jgi:hypothetical protein
MDSRCNRREFLGATVALTLGAALPAHGAGPDTTAEPVIDIHQHTNYAGRTDAQLIAHQQAMGATTTVLLPAGRFYGLDAKCGGNESVETLTRQHPGRFLRFANEVADLDEAPEVIRRCLRRGAIVMCDNNTIFG